ncbi:MAG: hypothetical protein HQL32_13320 [Planctomycetes bacterium]|nr:hypothetical protein [Planctomycetota bacterium]
MPKLYRSLLILLCFSHFEHEAVQGTSPHCENRNQIKEATSQKSMDEVNGKLPKTALSAKKLMNRSRFQKHLELLQPRNGDIYIDSRGSVYRSVDSVWVLNQ